jgi:hypothetical protein
MQISNVVIERHDGDTFCGVLTYEHDMHEQLLTWSFALNERKKVVLLLYPSASTRCYPEVEQHYRELADAILEQIGQGVR